MVIGKRREEVYSHEDLPGSAGLWQRGRQGGGRKEPVTDSFLRPLGKGVTGEPVTDGPSGPGNAMRSVLKDRSREESACEKSAALIRRPVSSHKENHQRTLFGQPYQNGKGTAALLLVRSERVLDCCTALRLCVVWCVHDGAWLCPVLVSWCDVINLLGGVCTMASGSVQSWTRGVM